MSHPGQKTCYSQLDSKSRTIRLLLLSPALPKENQRIQCRLKTVRLDDFPIYEALSYTWGKPDELGHQIWVDGDAINVRANLWHALQAIISSGLTHGETRAIWIDALCINQGDIVERNHQVGLMRDIYKSAVRVLVWLGSPQLSSHDEEHPWPLEHPSLAFEFLKTVSKSGILDLEEPNPLVKEFVEFPTFQLYWKQLVGLFKLPYWERVWIIQEICLAQRIKILYGAMECEWDDFCATERIVAHYVRYFDHPDQSTDFALANLLGTTAATLQRRRSMLESITLYDMVEISEMSLCQDKRDKIYGILGLVRDIKVEDIEIDYDKSIFNLYEDVIKAQVRTEPVGNNSLRFSQNLQRSLLDPGISGNREEFDMPRPESHADDRFICVEGFIITANISILSFKPQWLELKRDKVRSTFQKDLLSEELQRWSNELEMLWSADFENIATSGKSFSCSRVIETLPGASTSSLSVQIGSSSGQQSPKRPKQVVYKDIMEWKHVSIFSVSGPVQPATEIFLGIGPARMESTDLICHFSYLDTTLILRPQGIHGDLEIVGRAVLVTAGSIIKEQERDWAWPPLSFYHDFSSDFDERRIHILLDIVGLLCLTVPLKQRKL